MKFKINIITFFCFLLFLSFTNVLKAQEVLSGLEYNPVIKQYISKQEKINTIEKSSKSDIVLTLPFFDDFTYEGPYPDPTKWSDKYVFVNTGFQKNPANRGVATFDALDETGKIYSGATSTAFEADKLTSHKIRLDSIFGTEQRPLFVYDSLYLSFYYQPQGLGNKPEEDDVLLLEFFIKEADTVITIDSIYHPADTMWITDTTWFSIDSAYWEVDTSYVIYEEQWKSMWRCDGLSIDTFFATYGTWMKHVMIPITDASYLKSDFRFRFRNYASIGNSTLPSWQSNMDQWNIDYVYLNYNRYWFDTTYRDISFVNPGTTLLKNYTSMPYSQFKNDAFNAMNTGFEYTYSNLDQNTQNVDYSYRIYNSNGSIVTADYSSIEWSDYALPFVNNGFYTKNSDVILIYPIAPLLDSNEFIVRQWLRGDDSNLSDSVSYTQKFKNYYAYDDGTPEAGYGLTPANSKMAIHYTINHKDTLRAVDIFFNSTLERNSTNYLESFDLVVWSDNHGKPDVELFTQTIVLTSDEVGYFARFYLDELVPISAGGVFIGIIQSSDANLNIGYDYSNNQQNKLFYKTPADNWTNSMYEGSVMFRPVFGDRIHDYPEPETQSPKSITISPNPIQQYSSFRILLTNDFNPDTHNIVVDVFNLLGQRVYTATYSPSISLQNIKTGVYIIRVSNHTTGYVESEKLIVY